MNRESRLAGAAGPGDRHQTYVGSSKETVSNAQLTLATHEARELDRKVVARPYRIERRRLPTGGGCQRCPFFRRKAQRFE